VAEIRSVSVHLDADISSYVAKMRLAGAETDKAFGRSSTGIKSTNTALTTTERELGKVDTSVRRLGTDMDSTRVKVDNGSKSIDRYSGRLGLLGDVILGIGPALVPILAEAVPLTAALGTNLVAAGAGFAVVKLGLGGVGAALKAVNTAALEPTVANLQAADNALRALSPEARDFVLQLQGLKPVATELRDVAAGGLLPGVGQGLDALMGDLPILKSGIRGIANELGILARDAGQSLSSERWKPFLRFVGQEAPIGLAVMSRAIGDVAHGLAELGIDFVPTTHDIDRAILTLADDFDQWASSVGRTKGFEDFIAYLRENGPKVVDLLGATGEALINIGTAVAPLGGPVLDALTSVIKAISAIASSDLGTPIFEGILLFRLFTRAEQLWASTAVVGVRSFVAGQVEAVAAIRATTVAQQGAARSAAEVAAVQQKSSVGWATLGKGAARGAAGLASVGIAASGISGPLASNTVQFGLMGAAIGGPWGAALGAGIGLLADFKGGQDNSAAATVNFTETLNQQTGAITNNTKVLVAQTLQQDGALDQAEQLGISTHLVTQAVLGHADAQAKLQAQLDEITGVTQPGYIAGGRGMNSINQANALAAGELGTEVGKVSGKLQGSIGDWKQLSGALGHNVQVAEHNSRAQRLLQRDLQGERQAAQAAIGQWNLFGDSLDDTHQSLDQFIHDMARQATALAQFGNNALRAANKGLRDGLIKQLRDAGPEGALRMRQLANASQSEIAKANHAWDQWTGAIDSTQQALTRATSREWRMRVETAQAQHDLIALAAALAAIRSKTVTVTTKHVTGGSVKAGLADGGTVPGLRAPYGDKTLIHAAPGEEIISNRHGQADRFRADRASGRIPGYADGGTVTHVSGSTSTLFAGDTGLGSAANGATTQLRRLQGSLRDSTKELDAERQHRQQLAQQRQSLVSTVKSGFMSELFPTDNGIWAGSSTSDPADILHQDIRNARRYRKDIRNLRRRGLSDGVLSTLDTLDEAQAARGLSDKELHEVSRLYHIRQRAARAAGSTLGNAVYGDELAESNRHLKGLRDDVHRLTAQVKHLEHEQKKNAKATGDQVGKQINGASRTARRRGRPSP
jgi:hypothetical protein